MNRRDDYIPKLKYMNYPSQIIEIHIKFWLGQRHMNQSLEYWYSRVAHSIQGSWKRI